MKTSGQIRNDFIGFFQSRDHTFIRSAPVVPPDDPTLLFTNAGMNQFKSIFLGENPRGLKRAANSQKCMRVSGKHNDLEEVGRDHYHHTFFEMLGNWSFGDYYKKETIRWAWELLTEVWKLPKDRLFATVHATDEEAITCWKSETDIARNRIMPFGDKSNFWEMGETGPCGPCSEIHFDMGDAATRDTTFPDPIAGVNGTNDRYRELWNLVFIQYNREKSGTLVPLPARHVDTGMGFERVVAALQGADSNYDTDLFRPIIAGIKEISGRAYDPGVAGTPFRVAADHIRSLVFAITDGVFPSNEGRGYVVRRLLRRAARFGRELGLNGPYLYRLVEPLQAVMGEAFPEIKERRTYVEEVIRAEEERFGATLEQGLQKFSVMVDLSVKRGDTRLSGADVFTLYDTYGFPMDLTRLMASEKGLSLDEAEFERAMEKQKMRGREARKADESGLSPEGWIEVAPCAGTVFLGYEMDEAKVAVCRYKVLDREDGKTAYLLLLDKTPFYASSGGQVGDVGILKTASGKTLRIDDTFKWNDLVIQRASTDAVLVRNDFTKPLTASVMSERRAAIRRNHSATHLLQAALRKVLGGHVNQSGSRVDDRSLRFDFTHFKALEADEIVRVENIVNEWILENLIVNTDIKDVETAKSEGATALFGEKYGDSVRVVSMGVVSKELCGGTHVKATGQIGLFHIVEESSIASGVRRIEAITGIESARLLQRSEELLSQAATLLKSNRESIIDRLRATIDAAADLQSRLASLAAEQAQLAAGLILETALTREGALKWNVHTLGDTDKKSFNDIFNAVSDAIKRRKLDAALIVLAGVADGAVMLAACAGNAAVGHGAHCGEIVKAASAIVSGSGGGSPFRAQAGGKEPGRLPEALSAATRLITTKVKGMA
jgi:alanyl-tRNA synthetase